MSVAFVCFTDGRDCLHATLASLTVNLIGDITRWLLINDDPQHPVDLEGWECHNTSQRRGFAGTIGYAWELLHSTPERYICHWEDDFVLTAPVNLDRLCDVLDRHPELDQMALLRQPWNRTEIDAGGVLNVHPEAFTERSEWIVHEGWAGAPDTAEFTWIEHAEFFTTNPSVYKRSLTVHGWPQTRHSEGAFTAQRRAAGQRFGYWGRTSDGPRVEHIGTERVGCGY